MKFHFRSIILIGTILVSVIGGPFPFITIAQSSISLYPTVGEPCPEFFLTDVEHYRKSRVSLKDFKGKWLILDFWTKNCVVCVKAFPKLNQLQKEFRNDLQIFLVAKNDNRYNQGIKGLYEKFRVKQNLQLPIAYDTMLFNRFGVDSTPHVIVVNPDGVVKAITFSTDITQGKIRELLEGKSPIFPRKFSSFERDTVSSIEISDIFSEGYVNNAKYFGHRSVLTKWNRNMPISIATRIDQHSRRGLYITTATSLNRLYNVAYIGQTDWGFGDSLYGVFSASPILQIEDPTPFHFFYPSGIGYYNYSLTIPEDRANIGDMMWAMQCDLSKYFRYDCFIEKRKMHYWKLVVLDSSRLNKPRQKLDTKSRGDHSGFFLKETTTRNLLKIIWSYHQSEPPFIDETNIAEEIDVSLDAIMTDLGDVNRALKDNGLGLILDQKEMNVLVIRDGFRIN